jgi:hypothetical protein
MKTKFKLMLTLAMILTVGFIASCSDDDDGGGSADKDALLASIAEAETLLETTEEGTSDGQYLIGSQADLLEAATAAATVAADADASQTEVNNANVNLQAAIAVYEDSLITPIAPANLMAHWKFDEGTGTTAGDATANNLDGTFETGHAFWGAGNPVWGADRYGNANSAIYFNAGANIEVPYNTKLNPDQMTISLWMKQDINAPILNNQYMVALNRWNGWKLNMQDSPKAFMTVKADGPTWYDRDNADPILTQGAWYHVVVTFGGGHMVFYVNGVMVKDWDNTPGTAIDISANPINLTIGQDLPTDKYTATEGDFYVNWGGYFKGSLDEIRFYNAVLTGTQVTSLYNIEKPLE